MSCQAITRSGEPCASPPCKRPDLDARFCSAHQSQETRARLRIGGPQPGAGRPRAPRIGELVAAAAVEHSEELIGALRTGLKDPRQRVQAAGTWLRIAHREAELVQREHEREDDFDSLDRQQLLGLAARGLARLHLRGELELILGPDAAKIPALPALEGTAAEPNGGPQEARSDASTALPRPRDPALQAG